MQDKRYYSVSYDERNYPEIRLLRNMAGGLIAYARWEVLKQLLYSFDGGIALDDQNVVPLVMDELEFKTQEELTEYLDACRACKLIDWDALSRGSIVSYEVAEHLAFLENKSEAGKASAEARRKKKQAKESN